MSSTIKTDKVSFYRLSLVLLLSPLASLPLIMNEIIRGKHNLFPLLSCIMALCSILTPPFADLFRHSLVFEYYEGMGSDELSYIFQDKDYVVPLLEYWFAKFGLHFEFIRGILVFVCYQISFRLYAELLNHIPQLKDSYKLRRIVFLTFFLIVPFIWITNGLRSATSCYLLAYAWLCIYNGKNLKGWCYAAMGVFTHFFGYAFIPFLLLMYARKWHLRMSYAIYVISVIVFAVIGNVVLAQILGAMSEDSLSTIGVTSGSIDYYTGAGEDSYSYAIMSVNGIIALFLERSITIFIFLSTILGRRKWANSFDLFFTRCLFLLWVLLSSSFTPFQRISWLILPIVLFLYIKNVPLPKLRNRASWLLLCSIVGQISYIYGYREVFFQTPFYYLILPLPFSAFYTYPLGFNAVQP